MRPGELYFLTIPPPAGVGAFLAQHEWLAAILVVAALTALGLLARLCNVLIKEIRDDGYWDWRERREQFRDSQVVHDEGRRMVRLEGEQRRRELKNQSSSWWDQLRLFR